MAYVEFDYTPEDPDDLLTVALQRIQTSLPGWNPREAHVEYAVLSEMARLVVDTRILASDVADSIFRAYGERLIGLPPQPGVPASANAVFTFTDTSTRVVPAGTQVLWPTGTEPVLFRTVADVTNSAPGSAESAAVQINADQTGDEANGLAPATLDLVDAVSWIQSVRSTTTSAGGVDAEEDAEYLDRLSTSLQLLRRIPVLARDFAVLAQDTAGVYRALALDGYDPDTATSGNERTIAVAPVAEDGSPVPANVRTNLGLKLDAEREVNFVVKTLDPTYTALTVTFEAQTLPGGDAAAALAAAVENVKAYLSPAFWGGGAERPPVWRYAPTVRYLDVVGVIANTPGIATVLSVALNGGTANVTLAGAAPLPAANPTVTGTVTAP